MSNPWGHWSEWDCPMWGCGSSMGDCPPPKGAEEEMAERAKQAQEAQLPRGQDPRTAPKIELGGGRHPVMWHELRRGGLPEEHCPCKGGPARFGMPWDMFLARSAGQHGPGGDSGGPRCRAWLRNVSRSDFATHPGGEAMMKGEPLFRPKHKHSGRCTRAEVAADAKDALSSRSSGGSHRPFVVQGGRKARAQPGAAAAAAAVHGGDGGEVMEDAAHAVVGPAIMENDCTTEEEDDEKPAAVAGGKKGPV